MTLPSIARWRAALAAFAFAALATVLLGCQTPPPAKARFTDAQIAALINAGFTESDAGWGLNLDGRILFGSATDRLTDEARRTIAHVVEALKAVDIDRLRVEGHTDATGDDAYNLKLSQRRADSVAQAIAGLGLPYANIERQGHGSARPIADNATAEGRAQNRRVAIIVLVE